MRVGPCRQRQTRPRRPRDNAAALKKSILSHHRSAEKVGRVAGAARVKMLVLSHFVPSDDPEITDEMWTSAVRRGGYRGPVVLGKDLLEI